MGLDTYNLGAQTVNKDEAGEEEVTLKPDKMALYATLKTGNLDLFKRA